MYPILEPVDRTGNSIRECAGLVLFDFILLALRVRGGRYGGDVSLIVLGFSIGIGWGA